MKYIRTKDGVYKVVLVSPLGFVRIDKRDGTYPDVFEKDIINQSDTIEELCDGFYLDCEECELVDRFYYYHKQNDCFISFANGHRGFNRKCFKEYKADLYLRGFIKTDKGLIYVAKINEKGELELL